MSEGKIISAIDHGSVWQLLYEAEGDGIDSLYFDHRPFAGFYEGVTARSFFRDYAFGRGRRLISENLQGIRIHVRGKDFEEVVCLADEERGGNDT